MELNTSSKICISKRLTITALLLIMVGLSVIVFSTLSSSVNKTTSSKAEASASNTMMPIGGWGDPCILTYTTTQISKKVYWKLSCKEDVGLTCVAPLDFWLKSPESRDLLKDTKCLKYSEIPMGEEGMLCLDVPERVGQFRCKKDLVCANILDDNNNPTRVIYDYLEYLYRKYDANTRSKLAFTLDNKVAELTNKIYSKGEEFAFFVFYQMGNFTHVDKGFLKEPPGICIPSSLSTAENCGDVGQPACIREAGNHFCNNSRMVFDYNGMVNIRPWVCASNIKVDKKTLIQCDNRSNSCNDFCGSIGSKCVDTCEETIDLKLPGRDLYDGVSTLRGGLFEIGKDYKLTGKCTDKYLHSSPDYDIMTACGKNINDGTAKVMCCCDKK